MSGIEVTLGGNTPETGPIAPPPPPAPAAPRPAWLPEKFKTPEEMAQSYGELEKKLGGAPPAAPAAKVPNPAADLQLSPDAAKVPAPAQATTEDLVRWAQEYGKGGLKPDTYAEIQQKHGWSKEIVDSWCAGQESIRRELKREAYEVTGGDEQYRQMATWANQSLSVEERDAYNESTMSPNAAVRDQAVRGMWSRFNESFGGPGPQRLVKGGGPPGGGGSGGYESSEQMMAAMRDPRYRGGDTAYIAEVERKVSLMRR